MHTCQVTTIFIATPFLTPLRSYYVLKHITLTALKALNIDALRSFTCHVGTPSGLEFVRKTSNGRLIFHATRGEDR